MEVLLNADPTETNTPVCRSICMIVFASSVYMVKLEIHFNNLLFLGVYCSHFTLPILNFIYVYCTFQPLESKNKTAIWQTAAAAVNEENKLLAPAAWHSASLKEKMEETFFVDLNLSESP